MSVLITCLARASEGMVRQIQTPGRNVHLGLTTVFGLIGDGRLVGADNSLSLLRYHLGMLLEVFRKP